MPEYYFTEPSSRGSKPTSITGRAWFRPKETEVKEHKAKQALRERERREEKQELWALRERERREEKQERREEKQELWVEKQRLEAAKNEEALSKIFGGYQRMDKKCKDEAWKAEGRSRPPRRRTWTPADPQEDVTSGSEQPAPSTKPPPGTEQPAPSTKPPPGTEQPAPSTKPPPESPPSAPLVGAGPSGAPETGAQQSLKGPVPPG